MLNAKRWTVLSGPYSHLASIGCIATVLAVGFEPFIQNLVHYHPEAVVDGTTTAKLANTFNYSAVLNQVEACHALNPEMKETY